jgi:hypothetical protein
MGEWAFSMGGGNCVWLYTKAVFFFGVFLLLARCVALRGVLYNTIAKGSLHT